MGRPATSARALKGHISAAELNERYNAELSHKTGIDQLKPPEWLTERAGKEFMRLLTEGHKAKLWDNLDLNALAEYCTLWDRWRTLEDDIAENGPIVEATTARGLTYKKINPALKAQDTTFKAMIRLSASLGLTSIERLKLSNHKQPKKENKFISMLKNEA